MRETLRKFDAKYGESNVAALTAAEIKEWLTETGLAIKTRNRHLDYIHNAYNTAKKWGLLGTNPLINMELFNNPLRNGRRISILTAEQLTKFLNALRPEFVPFFAICAFTGLRRSEVELLEWNEVFLDRKLIILPPEKSKNRKRKVIEVTDNLFTFLEPTAQPAGPVLPASPGLQIIMHEAAEMANLLPWPQNVLWHSFCSHAVALQGLRWTSIQADHSETVLKNDYWEMVAQAEAEKYWKIRRLPSGEIALVLPKNSNGAQPLA
jgi:hypothetical protein